MDPAFKIKSDSSTARKNGPWLDLQLQAVPGKADLKRLLNNCRFSKVGH